MAFEKVPSQLRDLKGWLVWKYVQKPGDKKPRKVPFYAGGGNRCGEQGSTEDRSKLVTYDLAVARHARGGFDGIGFAMLPDWGIIGLDFDDCVVDGIVAREVESLIGGTYAELSPSGNGVRAFMLGEWENKKSRTDAQHWGFETFHSKGFLTITGDILPICELAGSNDNCAAHRRNCITLSGALWSF